MLVRFLLNWKHLKKVWNFWFRILIVILLETSCTNGRWKEGKKELIPNSEKYQNQKVPGINSNYLAHISNVAMEVILAYNLANNFNLNYTIQLALLHDTLEDTETNFSELSNQSGNRSSTWC